MLHNFQLKGSEDKPILVDLVFEETQSQKPLVVFVHGYKGYKDWGVFGKMDNAFTKEGFALLKFNFSHNGGTPEQPIDFPDLEAFGENNYTKELDDLQTVLDWITENSTYEKEYEKEIDTKHIILIGHSRGGGIATLTASKDTRVKKLVTWAAVSTLNRTMFQEGPELEKWKKDGVMYIVNGRTKQQMPHYIQFYHDYMKNEDLLNIEKSCKNIEIPHIIIHGDQDEAVPLFHAENLYRWSTKSILSVIPEANHVFGAKQPWTEKEFPEHFQDVLDKTLTFLKDL